MGRVRQEHQKRTPVSEDAHGRGRGGQCEMLDNTKSCGEAVGEEIVSLKCLLPQRVKSKHRVCQYTDEKMRQPTDHARKTAELLAGRSQTARCIFAPASSRSLLYNFFLIEWLCHSACQLFAFRVLTENLWGESTVEQLIEPGLFTHVLRANPKVARTVAMNKDQILTSVCSEPERLLAANKGHWIKIKMKSGQFGRVGADSSSVQTKRQRGKR